MKFKIEKVKREFLSGNKEIIRSSFISMCSKGKVNLNYKFKGEPNYDRVQLELELLINKTNVLEKYEIDSHVELPNQYPGFFELIDTTKNFVSFPHSNGFIIIDLKGNKKHLIKYPTGRLEYSYFLNGEFILVARKHLKAVSLVNFAERVLAIETQERVFILAVQIRKSDILVIVYNADLNDVQLMIFNKKDYQQIKKVNLSDYIFDNDLRTYLDSIRKSKLNKIPEFNFPTLISSWRYIKGLEKNSLNGLIQERQTPVKKGDYYERTENYGLIKISLEEYTC